jgi:hypothetical protein
MTPGLDPGINTAVKHDHGKPRWDLIPPIPLEMVADVYARGATKYGDRNMEKGLRWGRVFRALVSHAWKWWRGEACDLEDGQHHLASVVWCALTLMEYEIRESGQDDRVPYPAGCVRQAHPATARRDPALDSAPSRACPRACPRGLSCPGESSSPGDPRQLELDLFPTTGCDSPVSLPAGPYS